MQCINGFCYVFEELELGFGIGKIISNDGLIHIQIRNLSMPHVSKREIEIAPIKF